MSRIGLLLAASDAIATPDIGLSEVLSGQAAAFLSAGGVVTLSEWGTLSAEERAALVDARERIRAADAERLADLFLALARDAIETRAERDAADAIARHAGGAIR